MPQSTDNTAATHVGRPASDNGDHAAPLPQTQTRPNASPSPLFQVPRTDFSDTIGYSFPPFGSSPAPCAPWVLGGRTLWAARNASRAWTQALTTDPAGVDAVHFNLVVFDKVYEFNKSEWPYRLKHPIKSLDAWHARLDTILAHFYAVAGNSLLSAGGQPPNATEVSAFCHAAMNNCFVHLADARAWQPSPRPPTYTPAALGRWDPDLMNQDEFGETSRMKIEYDPEVGSYVVDIDDSSGGEDEIDLDRIDLDSSGGEDETSEGDHSRSCTPALSRSTSSAEHKG